ncbi:MAG: asparagine synthase (glutamine-hydrolyzing) [Bacteroidetes bacterium]|nr:asparagine synthase (glutamine-hydrolyzing) [Bacteroidota bacterium]
MCGIAGIVNLTSNSVQLPKLIQTMTGSIRHRGPDGEGFLLVQKNACLTAYGIDTPSSIINSRYTYSPSQNLASLEGEYDLALGHRRLSIIDLSDAGHQPMCDAQKKLWITYNGEIYNYIELREELKSKGYNFQTATDTEVILAAYQEWGTACVNKFNGMWAFVIYDEEQKKLFGSRDRFGVKPFYFVHTDMFFAFASEQKALLKAKLIQPKLNSEAVFDYFVFSKIENEEEGMFKGIFELQQACNFEFSLQEKKLTKWKYYTLPLIATFEKFDASKFQQLVNETREAIIQSIRLRLRSDVAVGSCLSGGIDSSSIVSIMNSLLNGEHPKINVFTASFEDAKIDEGKWAAQIVAQTNSKWSRTYPNADELKLDLENLMYSQDVPIWSTSTYAQYRVMQLAKENGVKVILDGQGGDELWAGYPHHQAIYLRELLAAGELKAAKSLLKTAGNFPSNAIWYGKQYFKHSGLASFPKK